LSENQYDGVIGLSQGAAMAALLISMVCKESLSLPIDSVPRDIVDKKFNKYSSTAPKKFPASKLGRANLLNSLYSVQVC
jgi:hypothetical protein